jgi:hypothetical protein
MAEYLISKEEAEALWAEIADNLRNAEDGLKRAVVTRAWEPLGYSSFEAVWNAKLKGIRLATDCMRATVVYALLDEGKRDDEIVSATGLGDRSVAVLRLQKEKGVPSDLATTRVRAHERSTPSPAVHIHVRFDTASERSEVVEIVESRGYAVEEWARKVLVREARRLEAGLAE